MISPSTIISIQQDLSLRQAQPITQPIKLKSIAFASLIPLAGPVLVPILLDKRKQVQGEKSEGGRDELGTPPDGTSFAWISLQSLLILSALGIAGSLHLGGYNIGVILGILFSIYAVALFVAWILIIRQSLEEYPREHPTVPEYYQASSILTDLISHSQGYLKSNWFVVGPILVPILLDKLEDANRRSAIGNEEKEELDELEVKDGTNFVWISVESLLVLAALGISGSLKLGGFGNWAVLGFFVSFYTIALIVAWILIVRVHLKAVGLAATRYHEATEFELVRGNDEEEDFDMSKSSKNSTGLLDSPDTTELNRQSIIGYYDSREGENRGNVGKSNPVEPPRRTISQKLRPFFLTAGAGLKNENAKATDSSEALSLVALLKARQPSFV
ncbi:hypothetical protein JCM5350_001769 [Sporobolomyces pararoseus]